MKLSELRQTPEIRKRGRAQVRRFCGWNTLDQMTRKCKDPIIAALFAVLFETGCRISEALSLRKDMFNEEEEDFIIIYGIPVLKKGTYKRSVPAWKKVRDIPIPRHEELVPRMMDWVDRSEDYLFASGHGGVHCRSWAWKKIVGIDESWWPHRIRSERATQLVTEYGYGVAQLMKFFNWSSPREAMGYVNLDLMDLKNGMKKS